MANVLDHHHNLNGGPGTSLFSSLDDDEESFVVLERSTASDVGPSSCQELNTVPKSPMPTISNFSNSHSGSFPVFNNRPSMGMSSSQTSHFYQTIPVESVDIEYDSIFTSESATDVRRIAGEILNKNKTLKENLFQTNLAMKQHLKTISLMQDRAAETLKEQQAKFEETKALTMKVVAEKNELQDEINSINEKLYKIKEENENLKETSKAFGTEASKLLSENDTLKKQLLTMEENLETISEKSRKLSLQPTAREVELHELVDQLTKKLEIVERARRQQDFDIDKLQAQMARVIQELNETQQKLSLSENALQEAQQTAQQISHQTAQQTSQQTAQQTSLLAQQTSQQNSQIIDGNFVEKVSKYSCLLRELNTSIKDEETRCNSLYSWLTMANPQNSEQFEISELRRLLVEEQSQSIAKKESLCRAVAMIQQLLSDYQKLGEDFECMKAGYAVKESHSLAYDEMQRKGFIEKIDSLTAMLVEKEEALAISERHLASIQEAVRLENAEHKDTDDTKTLKQKVLTLESENATKGLILQSNKEEITKLKTELQELRSVSDETVSKQTNEIAIKEQDIIMKNQIIERQRAQLETLATEKNDTVAVLQEQAKIFQDDFEVERRARETLVTEKERLLEDLRHLQRRNQQLIEQLNLVPVEYRQRQPSENDRSQERAPSPPPPRLGQTFVCPNSSCNRVFYNEADVYVHVVACWGLPD